MSDYVFDNAPFIFGGVSVLFGMILSGIALFSLKRMRESEGWPHVEGEIVESRVEVKERIVRSSRRRQMRRLSSSRVEIQYTPRVEYRYTIKGVEYGGNRIGFFQSVYRSEPQAQAILHEYPVGKTIPVYYDPWHPEKSVLKPGVDLGGFLMFFLIGGTFFIVGATLLLYAR